MREEKEKLSLAWKKRALDAFAFMQIEKIQPRKCKFGCKSGII